MKIQFNQVLKNLDGVPFVDPDGSQTKLSSVCMVALGAAFQDEPNLSGADKFARYELMVKLKGADEIDVSVEDIAKLKTLIGKGFGTATVGAAYDALEGRTRTPAKTVETTAQ